MVIIMDALLKNFDDKKISEISKANSEPQWLKDFRLSSFELFKKLPVEKSELFKKYVNLEGVEWQDFDSGDPKPEKIPDELEFIVSEKTSLVCCNSRIVESKKFDNVIFLDIASAVERYPELCNNYFTNKILKPDESKAAAFNSAFFNSGYFLYVPDNKLIDAPLRIINIATPNNSALVSQNIIIIGKNSKATLIEENYSTIKSNALVSTATDVHVLDNGELTFGNVTSLGENTIQILNKKVLLENYSKIFCSSGFFGSAQTLSNIDYVLRGNESEVDDFEIVFGTASQKFMNSANLFHEGVGTKGKVMAKGVFDDKSKGLFKGMINIGKNAKNSNAYLSGHSILLSKDASSDAIPGLQIETNDVKATHSASVAQINEEEIFYLMSRGFSKKEAQKLIVSGFFEPVIRKIHLPEVAFIIKGLFEIKWNKQDISKLKQVIDKISDDYAEDETSEDIFEGHYKYR